MCCFMCGRRTLLLSALCRGLVKKREKITYKWYVGTRAVSAAPTMYIVCVWYVGPLCSPHWSTSLPGHCVQHDPSSNQPVIDPVVLLWIPMVHRLNMYSVCVSVSSTSRAGWASSSTPHLSNLSIAFRMYPKATVMGRELSLFWHSSIFFFSYPSPPPPLYSPRHLSDAW